MNVFLAKRKFGVSGLCQHLKAIGRLSVFVISSLSVLSSSVAFASDYWSEDVWKKADRPFLFYGELPQDAREKEKVVSLPATLPASLADKVPQDSIELAQTSTEDKFSKTIEFQGLETLKRIESLDDLKREVQKRLEVAVMHPTAQSIGLYLQANAFLIDKAGVFAQEWRTHLVSLPQYDWSAQHPTVNAASTELSRQKRLTMESDLSLMSSDWGFVLLGDDSTLTNLMAGIVEDFTRRFGFELVTVSVTAHNAHLPNAKVDVELSKTLAGGITQFPALVLVHRSDTSATDARLIATGVVDAETLARRTSSFYPVSRPSVYDRGWLRVSQNAFDAQEQKARTKD